MGLEDGTATGTKERNEGAAGGGCQQRALMSPCSWRVSLSSSHRVQTNEGV